MYRAIIIDDESIGVNTLKMLIKQHTPEVKIVATATDPENGIKLIEDYKPDIVFLDISMPEMNGFELLDKLNYRDFKLVFTTAHEEYTLQAIKARACDYLLKPIEIDELETCIKNIKEDGERIGAVKTNFYQSIELSIKDGIVFIKPNNLIRLEGFGSYTKFYLPGGVNYLTSKNLKEYETLLDPFYFYRCHLSHIVNLSHVLKIITKDGLFAEMNDGSLIEIAKKNKQVFLNKLKNI